MPTISKMISKMIFKSFRRPFDRTSAAAALALSLVATAARAAGLAGAGGGAIYPLLSRWADQYAKETGDTINYQAVGSGGTILQQMELKTILFANTDIPLSPADVARNNLVQFPIVIISIMPVVNLKSIKPGELVFDGPTLANIYLGNVKEWNDPAIRKLNPGVNLPHQAITTVHRSDGLALRSTSPTTSRRSAPNGSRRSAKALRSIGRPASAAKAIRASCHTCSKWMAPSAMSSSPTRWNTT